MKYFRWSAGERYAEFSGKSDEDACKLDWFTAAPSSELPPLSKWVAPRLEQFLGPRNNRKPKPIGDSPTAGLLRLVSDRAANALDDVWSKHAQLYPVILEGSAESYYMVVVDTVIDALDRKRSVGKRNVHGGNPNHFAQVEEWIFDESMLDGVSLFRLPDSKIAYYVSQSFRDRVVEAKLKGFVLKKSFWDEKPFVS